MLRDQKLFVDFQQVWTGPRDMFSKHPTVFSLLLRAGLHIKHIGISSSAMRVHSSPQEDLSSTPKAIPANLLNPGHCCCRS